MDPSKHILELADGPDIGLERYFLGSYASLCVCLCACERDGWSIAVASSKDHSGKPAGGGKVFPICRKKLESTSSLASVSLVMAR